jgi:hypothetical protein
LLINLNFKFGNLFGEPKAYPWWILRWIQDGPKVAPRCP